jgi:hypothetical protein
VKRLLIVIAVAVLALAAAPVALAGQDQGQGPAKAKGKAFAVHGNVTAVDAAGKTVSLKIWGGAKWLRKYRTEELVVTVADSTKIVRRAFGEATAVALSDVKVGERIWVAGTADRSNPNSTVFTARWIKLQATWPFQVKATITALDATTGEIKVKVNRAMVAMKPYIGEEVAIQTTTETVFKTCVDGVVTELTFADLKVDQRVVVGGAVDNTAPTDKQFIAKRVLVKQ